MANEVQCCQMSLYESYSALFTQTNYSQLHTASANLGKRSVCKISWHITITENMDWGQHISDISSKVAKTLCFLRRNLTFAPRNTKEGAYKTLVRSKLEYAAPIWSPYCKTQIQRLEKVMWTLRRWRDTSSVGEYELKRMKLLELQITQTRHTLSISDGKNMFQFNDELQWPTVEA